MSDELKIEKSVIRVRFKKAVQSLPGSKLCASNMRFLSEMEKHGQHKLYALLSDVSIASKQIQTAIKGLKKTLFVYQILLKSVKIGQKLDKNWKEMVKIGL